MCFPSRRVVCGITCVVWVAAFSWNLAHAADQAAPAEVSAEQARFFEQHVRPLLIQKCQKCHGADKQSGNLRLDSRGALLLGGDSGPAIVPGSAAESLLVEAINYESYEMPPDGKLGDDEIALLTKWIALGAPWPGDDGKTPVRAPTSGITDEDREHWCFQPLRHPEPPIFAGDDWSRTDVDRFVRARLSDAGLSPQREADRLTLIRRATQIVTGMPPTIDEIDAFLSDDSPQAYERLIDRLLDSPRRGEHLARFWLDLVRYAESDGFRADGYRPTAWRYRDYVINAFNSDKPYDLFVAEQLAGDELDPGNPEALAATGYLRAGIYEYNQRDAEGQWKAMLEDITETTADTFLALGLGCAKCHNHKFDPLLQTDYYQFQAFFSNIAPRDETPLATPEQLADYQRRLKVWEEATADVRRQLAELEEPRLKKLEHDAVKMFVPELQAIWNKPARERTAHERQIAWLIEQQVIDSQKKLGSQFKGEEKAQRDALLKELQSFEDLKPSPPPAGLTVADASPNPSPLFVPDKSRLGEMEPAFLTVLGGELPEISPPEAAPNSSGRRAALVRWLTQPDNPLTSRVIVNRIWQQHFGTGLVATPSDFGRLGEEPSHPELLDWLATEFVSQGWSIKRLQRQILLSAVFRQASIPGAAADDLTQVALHKEPADPGVVDPDNRLLWHYPVRRLSAEQIRDAMLAASGELELAANGPSVSDSTPRRSIYLRVERNQLNDLLEVFDFPDRLTSTGERNITTTPTQSLLMINSDWTIKRATAFAKRVAREVPSGDDSRIRLAYRLAFGRDPSEHELLRDAQFLQSLRDAHNAAPADRIATRSMLLTGSTAAWVGDGAGRLPLLAQQTSELPQGSFTIEAVVLLNSVYEDASVRTIASRWNGDTQHPGWSLGVTSQKSRYKPRNLILQLVGASGDGKVQYEVIPSGIHLELERPYYVACVVNLEETGAGGVTFYVRDLVDPQGELQAAGVAHQVTSGLASPGPLLLGGRQQNNRHRWDGLLDDVRWTSRVLSREELLAGSRRNGPPPAEIAASEVVGRWAFDSEASRGAEAAGSGRTLSAVGEAAVSDEPLTDLCHVLLNSNEFLYID